MTDTTPTYRGRFVWYDLMTTDQKAAQAFYTSVAGWGIDQWDMGGSPYYMWTVGGTSIGGMRELPAEATAKGGRTHWLGHIATPDVDATVAQAVKLGATVMFPPTVIPTVGKSAVLNDPFGAEVGFFMPEADAPGHAGQPAIGDMSWCELATTDIDAALEFYGTLFGWTLDSDVDMGPDGVYRMFARDGVPMGGMYKVSASMPIAVPPSWTFYILVADIHAAAERVTAAGGKVVMPPREIPGGMIFMATDPQGGMFAAHALSAS